jgi:hypothetical protein
VVESVFVCRTSEAPAVFIHNRVFVHCCVHFKHYRSISDIDTLQLNYKFQPTVGSLDTVVLRLPATEFH